MKTPAKKPARTPKPAERSAIVKVSITLHPPDKFVATDLAKEIELATTHITRAILLARDFMNGPPEPKP
jgi:hypothetical protein